MRNKKISKFTVLLLALILVFGVSAQSTIAYLMAETQPVVNTFEPIKTADYDFGLKVEGTKELKGRDWKTGDAFNFVLQVKQDDPDTAEKEKWSWAGNASVTAKDEIFDLSDVIHQYITRAGAHEFRLYEIPGDEEGMKYDDTVYQMLVVVEENAESGDLFVKSVNVAETDLETDADTFNSVEEVEGVFSVAATFVNEYDKPEEPTDPSEPSQPTDPSEPSKPTEPGDGGSTEGTTAGDDATDDEASKTGDDMNIVLWMAIMIASGAVIVLVLADRKRRKA